MATEEDGIRPLLCGSTDLCIDHSMSYPGGITRNGRCVSTGVQCLEIQCPGIILICLWTKTSRGILYITTLTSPGVIVTCPYTQASNGIYFKLIQKSPGVFILCLKTQTSRGILYWPTRTSPRPGTRCQGITTPRWMLYRPVSIKSTIEILGGVSFVFRMFVKFRV